MNKFLASLLAGVFALSLGSSAFALDTAKTTNKVKETASKKIEKVAEPAKTEAAAPAVAAEPAKAESTTKSIKKHHRKHDAKVEAEKVETAPTAK